MLYKCFVFAGILVITGFRTNQNNPVSKQHTIIMYHAYLSKVFFPKHNKLIKLERISILLIKKKKYSSLTDSHKNKQKTKKQNILKFCGW